MKPGTIIKVFVLLLAAGILAAACISNRLPNILPASPTPKPTPTPIPMEVIVNEIKKAAELVTVIVQEDVQPANYHQINGTCGLLTLDDTIIQYTGSGSVRAGIDLLLISENDIKRSGEAVTVNLPPAQIIIVSSDANVFDTELANDFLVCKDNVAIKPESINLIQATVKQAILQAACDKNILEKANTFAKDYVYGLLKGLGFTEITLNTQAVGNCP